MCLFTQKVPITYVAIIIRVYPQDSSHYIVTLPSYQKTCPPVSITPHLHNVEVRYLFLSVVNLELCCHLQFTDNSEIENKSCTPFWTRQLVCTPPRNVLKF